MSKIILAAVGLSIAPLLVVLMLPALACLAVLAPCVLPLAALVLVAARPHNATGVAAASARQSPSEPELLSQRRARLALVSQRFLESEPSNAVCYAPLAVQK